MSNTFWDHPVETIERALHIRKQIEALEASLREFYGDGTQPLSVEKPALAKDGRKGKRSAAARAKMAAAAKARWAKKRGQSSAKPVAEAKKKRATSAATRAKMAAAQRARRSKEKITPLLNAGTRLVW